MEKQKMLKELSMGLIALGNDIKELSERTDGDIFEKAERLDVIEQLIEIHKDMRATYNKLAGVESLEFIRNVLSVEVDGLKGVNTYTIKAMYNKVDADGFATVVHQLVDSFQMTWDEIERDGGTAQVNADFKECYGLEDF